jgi:iron complex transport system substrate-binding protein
VPVGVGQALGGQSRLDVALNGVPVLPLSHPNGPNIEQLAALSPDLVLSTTTWQRGEQAMRGLGMRVVDSDPRSVAQASAEIRRIGRLTGRESKADALARQVDADVAKARAGISRHPTVMVVLGVGRTPYVALANSWAGDVVRRAGGRLLTGGLKASGGMARISNEAVVERDPDVIVAIPHGSPSDLPRIAAYLRDNPAWRSTRAARAGRIHVAADDHLLEPWPDVGDVIREVRRKYLHD